MKSLSGKCFGHGWDELPRAAGMNPMQISIMRPEDALCDKVAALTTFAT